MAGDLLDDLDYAGGEPAGRTLAGGGKDLTGPSQEALHVEGPVGERHTSPQTDTTLWVFSPDDPPRQADLSVLADLITVDENLAWIDLGNYTSGQVRDLAAVLHLVRAEVYAILSRWQRPRLDVYDHHFFVSATLARLDSAAHRVIAGQLDLCVGHNYLLSLHRAPLPFNDRILARARQSPELIRFDSAFMLYIVLDELLAYYEDLYEEVQDEVERMEEHALTDTSDGFLEDLLEVKRYVTALARVVEQHRQVFAAFLRPDFRFVHGEEVEVYYRDLEARLAHLTDTLDDAQTSVNGAFDIYVSHVSHRTNQIIRVLTIVSTLLLPSSLIVSLFATSFHDVPLYGAPGFFGMIAAIILVTAGILLAFRRQGWL